MAAPISTTYTPEERETIIAHVLAEVAGGRSVSKVLKEDDAMPCAATFWGWQLNDEELLEKVTHARAHGVEAKLDEGLEIVDDLTEDPASRRVRFDARVKMAQMLKPKSYGAKLDLTSGGEPIRPMDDTEKLTRLASIFAKAEQREPDSGVE